MNKYDYSSEMQSLYSPGLQSPNKPGMGPGVIILIVAIVICCCIYCCSSFSGAGTGGYFYFGGKKVQAEIGSSAPSPAPVSVQPPYTETLIVPVPTPVYTPVPQQPAPVASPPYTEIPVPTPTPLQSPPAPSPVPSPVPITAPSPVPITAPSPVPSPTCPTSYTDVTVTGSISGTGVWGSGPYTTDSDMNKAAVHAGLITVGQQAIIKRTNAGYVPSYTGSTKNGITTTSYSGFCGVNLSLGSIISQAPAPVSVPTPVPVSTPVPTPVSTRSYTFYSGYDSPLNDIKNIPWDSSKDPTAHMVACDATANCVGFNSDGWLKNVMYDPAGKSKSWTDPSKGMWAVKLTSTSGTVGPTVATTTTVPVSTSNTATTLPPTSPTGTPTGSYTLLQLVALVKARLDGNNAYWNYEYVKGNVVNTKTADFLFKKIDRSTNTSVGLDARRAYFTMSGSSVVIDSTALGGGIDSSGSGLTVLPGPVVYYGAGDTKLTTAAMTYYNTSKPNGTTMTAVTKSVAIDDTNADYQFTISGGSSTSDNRRFTFGYDSSYKVIATAMGAAGSANASFPAPAPPPTFSSQFSGPQYLLNRDIVQWLKFNPAYASQSYKQVEYGALASTTDTSAQWAFELYSTTDTNAYYIKNPATNHYLVIISPQSTVLPITLGIQATKPYNINSGVFRVVKSTGGNYSITSYSSAGTRIGAIKQSGSNYPSMIDNLTSVSGGTVVATEYNFEIKGSVTSTDVSAPKITVTTAPNPIGTVINLKSNATGKYLTYSNLVLDMNGTATNAVRISVIPTGTVNQYRLKPDSSRFLTVRPVGTNGGSLGADQYPTGNDIWTITEKTPGSGQWFLFNGSYNLSSDGSLFKYNVGSPSDSSLYSIIKIEGFDEGNNYFNYHNIIWIVLLLLVILCLYYICKA